MISALPVTGTIHLTRLNMGKFFSYDQLLENLVETSSFIQEFEIVNKGRGNFTFKKKGTPVSFSLFPLPRNFTPIKDAFFKLNEAVKINDPVKLYSAIMSLQKITWHFGKFIEKPFSFRNTEELMMTLEDDQKKLIGSSPLEFLQKSFQSLSKTQKNNIIEHLLGVAKEYAVVIESLFSYVHQKTDKIYDGKTAQEILKEYSDKIKSTIEYRDLSDPVDSKNLPISDSSEYAFWKIIKKGISFTLRGTISPKILSSEDYITGEKGLHMTILVKNKEVGKDFTDFPIFKLKDVLNKFFSSSK